MNSDLQDSADTEQLLAAAAAGDASSLRALFELHRAPLRRMVALRLDDRLRQRIDESDVLQDTFCEIQQRLTDFVTRRPMSFTVWLRKTARQHIMRLYRTHIRAGKRSLARERTIDESSQLLAQAFSQRPATPSELLVKFEFQTQVQAAIARLPRLAREILVMRHLEGLSHRDIGALLGITEANARQRYGRALVRLRSELSQAGVQDDSQT